MKPPLKPPNPFRYFNASPEVIRLVVLMYVDYPLWCCQPKLRGPSYNPAAFPISGSMQHFLEQIQEMARRLNISDIPPPA